METHHCPVSCQMVAPDGLRRWVANRNTLAHKSSIRRRHRHARITWSSLRCQRIGRGITPGGKRGQPSVTYPGGTGLLSYIQPEIVGFCHWPSYRPVCRSLTVLVGGVSAVGAKPLALTGCCVLLVGAFRHFFSQ